MRREGRPDHVPSDPPDGATRRHIGVVVVAVAVLLTSCSSSPTSDDARTPSDPRILQPGAPGEDNEQLAPDQLAARTDTDSTQATEADVRFMQAMHPHHRQALVMTALVDARTARDDIPQLARRMEISQEAEVELIERWLASHGEAVPADTDHSTPDGHEHDDTMPGMLTAAQIDELAGARGDEFDRLFLESMIRHHEGALLMVQQLFEAGGGLEPETFRFANHVDADQRTEITRMQELLDELASS